MLPLALNHGGVAEAGAAERTLGTLIPGEGVENHPSHGEGGPRVAQEEDAAILYKKRQQSLADAKDQEIIFLKGQVQALKETIQMLGGKNSNVDVPMPLQKKNA